MEEEVKEIRETMADKDTYSGIRAKLEEQYEQLQKERNTMEQRCRDVENDIMGI